jgi:hypothetical protein
MPLVWFLISVVANLITPVPAIGGAFTGALWATHRPKAAFVVLGSTMTIVGYLSVSRYAGAGDIAYSMGAQWCAMVPWIFFAALLAMLLPEELAGSTRGGPSRWLARIRA